MSESVARSIPQPNVTHPNVRRWGEFDQYIFCVWRTRLRVWVLVFRWTYERRLCDPSLSYGYVYTTCTRNYLSQTNRATHSHTHTASKKEKDNIKIDDFNSVSIALPDSKLVNSRRRFFFAFTFVHHSLVCDINALRGYFSFFNNNNHHQPHFFRYYCECSWSITRLFRSILLTHSTLFNIFELFFLFFVFRTFRFASIPTDARRTNRKKW